MAKVKNKEDLSLEQKLEQALIPVDERPYDVPENWCWVKVGNTVDLHRGVSYKKNEGHSVKEENDCLVMRGGNILEGAIDVEADNIYVDKSLIKSEQYVRENDIIIVSSTGSTKVIGRAGISYADYEDVSFGAFLTLVRPKDEICKRYVDYYFQSQIYRERIRSLASGVNINNIRTEYITNSPIPLPPLAEQQRIVEQIESLFAKLDEAKEQVQSVLGNSEERKSAILFKAYSGDLTKGWRKQNGKSQDEWQEVCLKDVCKINPPKINAKDYDDDLEVSFFPMPALSEVTGTINEPQTRKLGEVKSGFTNFSEGDVVFAKITPCMENGKSAIIGKLVNDIGYGTTEFYVMRCSDRLLNGYLYHLVRSKHFRDEAKSVMTGAVGQQRVPKSFLEEYELKLPSIEEQEEILRIVDEMVCKEHQVAVNCENVIEQIDMMKKSILARAFRGELGTNNPDEESAIKLLRKIVIENK